MRTTTLLWRNKENKSILSTCIVRTKKEYILIKCDSYIYSKLPLCSKQKIVFGNKAHTTD